jgi:hypothetical protein
MSQITSTVNANGLKIPVSTPIDPNKSSGENLDAHTTEVATTTGTDQGDSISTTWPGLPAPVVTARRPAETFSAWLIRHQDRCAAAATNSPIS